MPIHIQLIQRAQTLHPERDLTISEDIAPLLDQAELYYYVYSVPDPRKLCEIGQTLYRWLDGDDRFLTRAIDQQRGKTRAVALLIEQGAGFSHLPWELLHDGSSAETGGGYLVQQSTTAVIPVRWQNGHALDGPFYRTPQNRPLHVAFMATAPAEAAERPLDFEGEEARIMEATQRHPLRLSVEESGNLQELGDLLGDLGEAQTDVVHLTGHATHTRDGPRFLCEDEVGGRQLAGAQEIVDRLTHVPRLIFLSGCRTGQAMQGGAGRGHPVAGRGTGDQRHPHRVGVGPASL
ncbi:CHAT domain-containing protein [Chloroflexi bacterium TSY]|nr:CHAT domain-containing protein [Chloroflexi bacterium TSY]